MCKITLLVIIANKVYTLGKLSKLSTEYRKELYKWVMRHIDAS